MIKHTDLDKITVISFLQPLKSKTTKWRIDLNIQKEICNSCNLFTSTGLDDEDILTVIKLSEAHNTRHISTDK